MNTFDIVNPITWAPSMLTSSTATESVALWSNVTAYTVGVQARLDTTNKIYECLIAHTGASPDVNLTGDTPKWLEVGATNKHAMFDAKWGTQTTATSTLTVVVTPNLAIDSLALLNLLGDQVTISCTVGGVSKYSKTISLQTDVGVYDWLTYFTAPIVAQDDVVVSDLLPYNLQVITITITGTGTVGIGNLAMGSTISLGRLLSSPSVSIVDYSRKETDDFGNIVITQRAYSKKFSGRIVVADSFVDQLASILAAIRSTPVVWVGSDKYSSLIVWGFYRDFEVDIAFTTHSFCTITIEGLV